MGPVDAQPRLGGKQGFVHLEVRFAGCLDSLDGKRAAVWPPAFTLQNRTVALEVVLLAFTTSAPSTPWVHPRPWSHLYSVLSLGFCPLRISAQAPWLPSSPHGGFSLEEDLLSVTLHSGDPVLRAACPEALALHLEFCVEMKGFAC